MRIETISRWLSSRRKLFLSQQSAFSIHCEPARLITLRCVCTLSIPNIRKIFPILSCTPSLGHGLNPQGCPCLQCFPQLCQVGWISFVWWTILIFIFFYPLFSPISWYPIVLVATILSHRYNSRMGAGETKVESHASSDAQPNQAALLLNTARIQPGSQPHQCVGGNAVHLATLHALHPACHRSRWCVMRQGYPTGLTPPYPGRRYAKWASSHGPPGHGRL